ncbi:uncharacterized protein [Physcomitrium patens]|uniref:uncharacterized protein n=1 Tax=Physcomitrium patens TaxID=3218 RepID=UPI003CCDCA2E
MPIRGSSLPTSSVFFLFFPRFVVYGTVSKREKRAEIGLECGVWAIDLLSLCIALPIATVSAATAHELSSDLVAGVCATGRDSQMEMRLYWSLKLDRNVNMDWYDDHRSSGSFWLEVEEWSQRVIH